MHNRCSFWWWIGGNIRGKDHPSRTLPQVPSSYPSHTHCRNSQLVALLGVPGTAGANANFMRLCCLQTSYGEETTRNTGLAILPRQGFILHLLILHLVCFFPTSQQVSQPINVVMQLINIVVFSGVCTVRGRAETKRWAFFDDLSVCTVLYYMPHRLLRGRLLYSAVVEEYCTELKEREGLQVFKVKYLRSQTRQAWKKCTEGSSSKADRHTDTQATPPHTSSTN